MSSGFNGVVATACDVLLLGVALGHALPEIKTYPVA
jgi:hypothetical protein